MPDANPQLTRILRKHDWSPQVRRTRSCSVPEQMTRRGCCKNQWMFPTQNDTLSVSFFQHNVIRWTLLQLIHILVASGMHLTHPTSHPSSQRNGYVGQKAATIRNFFRWAVLLKIVRGGRPSVDELCGLFFAFFACRKGVDILGFSVKKKKSRET